AVNALGHPVTGERRTEAAEHVVAGQPPTADVEEHRRHGIGNMQIIEDPEELALAVLPLDGKPLAPVERPQRPIGHSVSPLHARPRQGNAPWIIDHRFSVAPCALRRYDLCAVPSSNGESLPVTPARSAPAAPIRTVLREQVKELLLERIISGELEPGQRLV